VKHIQFGDGRCGATGDEPKITNECGPHSLDQSC
jgi:hypothetical protein